MKKPAPLARYNAKRDFDRTPEPSGRAARGGNALSFVIQKHWASHLHYDFRLELDGVLLSWAVPKGPSLDPSVRRMAIHVEDHPVSYGGFEGRIPDGQYGAGTVIVWDRGTWDAVGDPHAGLKAGKLVFVLHGEKLAGLWELVRIAKPGDRQEAWLLFKKRDEAARASDVFDVVTAQPDSVISKDAEAESTPEPSLVPKGAKKARLPAALAPQLATLAKAAPAGDDWSVEAKFDGYRILARIAKGEARLFTRNGNDWTDRLRPVAKAVEGLGLQEAWLDGEIVVAKKGGGQDFNALQNAIDHASGDAIEYFLFDAPYLTGYDLRAVPLAERRAALKTVLDRTPNDRVRYSDDFPSAADEVLKAACAMKLEGVILKRRDAHYVSARSATWLKLKCTQRQEFVIGGYTDRSDSTKAIGNLLLGVYDDHRLHYVGAMGTGWSLATARELKQKLQAIETDASPFERGSAKQTRWSRRVPGSEHWVKPELVAEVVFAEWTPDGHLRHASFQGLRTDKPAKSIVRERAVAPPSTPRRSAASKKQPVARRSVAVDAKPVVSGVRVSSPDRVIDASTGTTKLDLVRYYDSVADRILPHLKGRPVSLVRGPSGIGGELFFQKHMGAKIAGVTVLDASLWPEHGALIQIDTKAALLSAAQFNTIEFHTWNAMSKAIDRPDRIVFDLDPGEGVAWAQVREAAALTRTLLDELGLVAYLKTSGGKGLHVVVPLAPRDGWDTVKDFSQAVVQHLAKTIPDRFVAKSGPSNRVGRVFVDYLRNGHGATTAVAFSARARPGLGVSIPVSWEALPSLESGTQWTVANARDALSFESKDPWAGYRRSRQTVTAAMKRLAEVA